MLRLDFSASDLNLAENREKTRRASISGVQDKVQLKRVRGGFAIVESGGDYVFANGDAHLKNFSLYRSEQGDYILTPAYDLLNTAVHFPNEPTATGLDFFADGHFTPAYEALGFYSSADFIELGTTFGVPEEEVCGHIARFQGHRDPVTRLIETLCLSEEAKSRYLDKFVDRLRAICAMKKSARCARWREMLYYPRLPRVVAKRKRKEYLMKNLEGKIALVTGAGRGIGQQIAKQLAEQGAKVAGVDLKPEWCEETCGLVTAAGSEALALGCNVAVSDEVNACVKAVLDKFGRIDILINNAGITKDGLLMRMSDEDWDAVLNVNLKGTFLFTRAVARPMMKNKSADGVQEGGSIVNLASVVGIMGNAGQANYTASKGGVIALTKTTAKELGSRNIRCNAVAPGFIQSKMTDVLPDDVKKAYMDTIPLRRFGTAEDIAKCVGFLVSPDAAYITGQIISVNGGMIG